MDQESGALCHFSSAPAPMASKHGVTSNRTLLLGMGGAGGQSTEEKPLLQGHMKTESPHPMHKEVPEECESSGALKATPGTETGPAPDSGLHTNHLVGGATFPDRHTICLYFYCLNQ